MAKSSDPRLKILIIASMVVILGVVVAGILSTRTEKDTGLPQMKIDSTFFDFGTISMADGKVKHSFTIKNEGTGDLRLTNISTSCMCTTAILEGGGETSPIFGMHNNPTLWSKKIKPGQSANLEVIFDPTAHGPNATGPVTRTVTMYSNDGGKESVKTIFTITANVVK